ncbi:cation/H(+) antiporter 4-like [Hibiscus syriacus]|nr:cation/H(+) antiporter 4-like [Hibiscus syriacus]
MIHITYFLATTYAGISFPVIHDLLMELRILNSELGRLGLAAALIGDMMTIVITLFGIWLNKLFQQRTEGVLFHMGVTMFVTVIAAFVLRPAMKWMANHTTETGRIKDVWFYVIVVAFMVAPLLAGTIGLQTKYGPIILGLAVPEGPPLGSSLVEKLDPVSSELFLPVFLATSGMRFNLSDIRDPSQYTKDHVVGAAVTLFVKFGVSLVLTMFCKMPIKDSLAFSLIMISKGIVEIASYSNMKDMTIMSDEMFCYLTIMIILVSSIVPILVKRLYDPSRKYLCFQKRTIMNTKLNQELRMISCIHVPDNVNSIISLLHACCLTRDSFIALDVLHLVKLRGRATPIFIAHDALPKTKSNCSYSENAIVAFSEFQRNYLESVSVKVFTAVSPPNSMYEDICKLAMDRLTSFILLPFHRWCIDGSTESEDQTIRNLNFHILEMAPCSVGILVDVRHNLNSFNFTDKSSSSHNSSSYNIAVIFMGGQDDREALALAKRISQDESVSLTVIHLKSSNRLDTFRAEIDRMLDEEMLSDIKESVKSTYLEEQVTDGTESAR